MLRYSKDTIKKNSCSELYLFNVILTVISNYDSYKLQCHQEIFDVHVESNSSLFNEFVCKLGSFSLWHEWVSLKRE
jgi:predicted ABC-type exoprotein transport system permease subunit